VTGVDTNSNGKFEILRVRAGLVTVTGGFFQWSATLVSPSGIELEFGTGTANLSVGANTITVDFKGSAIGASCANGPYAVRSLLIFGAGQSLVIPQLLRTPTFTAQQFENSSCDHTPPVTTAASNPVANNRGWNKTDTTIALTSVDNVGGSGVKEIHYTLTGAQTGSGVVPNDYVSLLINAPGTTTLSYFSRDMTGNDEAIKTTVIRIDKTAPSVSCRARPDGLWPADHRLVQITVSVTVTDPLSGTDGFMLLNTASNESDDGLGDGDTANDIQGLAVGKPSTTRLLRAERAGTGTGRQYTIVYDGADVAGNKTRCTTAVTVPLNQAP
jgi:hypothetical protein